MAKRARQKTLFDSEPPSAQARVRPPETPPIATPLPGEVGPPPRSLEGKTVWVIDSGRDR